MKRALEFGNNPLFYWARKVPGKSTGASKNAIRGPVKFSVKALVKRRTSHEPNPIQPIRVM